jgi:hypothetical protein
VIDWRASVCKRTGIEARTNPNQKSDPNLFFVRPIAVVPEEAREIELVEKPVNARRAKRGGWMIARNRGDYD